MDGLLFQCTQRQCSPDLTAGLFTAGIFYAVEARPPSNNVTRQKRHLLALAVDADVIHQHLLGKLCSVVRTAGPDAADCQIQNNKKWMSEDPLAACRPLRLGEGGVVVRVDIEADRAGLPLDGEDMKIVGVILPSRQGKSCS